MIKRLLTALALLLPLGVMAQHWNAKTTQDLPNSTVVYAQLNINGEPATANTIVELGAFIEDDCRAYARAATHVANETTSGDWYVLRVVGDLSTETGEQITFRAFYNNIEYEFTTKVPFNGETYTPAPLELNLDVVTGVSLPQAIEISQPVSAFPYTEDLTQYITLTYNQPTGAPYTPLGQSTILSPISYQWNVGNYVDQLTFDGNNLTVGPAVEENYGVSLTVNIGDPQSPALASFSARTTIQVTIPAIPVRSITCDISSTDFYVMEDFSAWIDQHVQVLPENASDKGYHLVCPENLYLERNGMFDYVGPYMVQIVPNDQNYEGEIPTVDVTVYARPTNISTNAANNTINAHYGQNIFDAIAEAQELQWPFQQWASVEDHQYAKDEVTYTFEPSNLIDQDGMAIGIGTVTATVTLKDGITPMPTFQGQASYDVTVEIVSGLQIAFRAGETNFVKNGEVSTAYPAYVDVTNPYNETFDPAALTIQFDYRYEVPGLRYAEQRGVEPVDSREGVESYGFVIEPLFVGRPNYRVIYNGNVINEAEGGYINISKEETLKAGWTWVSLATMGGNVADIIDQSKLVEIRSQQDLLWNDPTYGYVGNITYLDPYTAMYKIKTNSAMTVNWGDDLLRKPGDKTIFRGYTWVNYPYEFSLSADRIPELLGIDFTPNDGDRIITQYGFAEYDADTQSWTADPAFALQEGKGMLYFCNVEGDPEPQFISFDPQLQPTPADPSMPVKAFASRHLADDILQYDVHAFADNMSMVAEIQGLENPEDYTLGAFVDDECRGRGHVAVDGKMFVSAVGMNGEHVSFKLVNNRTGKMIPVEGTVSFGMLKGSLRAPVKLNIATPTGISSVENGQVEAAAAYDLSGRRISGSQRGISIQRMADGTVRKVVKK